VPVTRPLSDSRIRGKASGYAAPFAGKITDDPPDLSPCPHCLEIVIKAHKRYFDAPAQLHEHQPHLFQDAYGEFQIRKREGLPE
jgi:hypothetical protein